MSIDQRLALETLVRERREELSALSRLIGRNPAYIHQFIRRGSPRRLEEGDRRTLAAYFGVPDEALGGPPERKARKAAPAAAAARLGAGDLVIVPQLEVEVSAGPGATADRERRLGGLGFDAGFLRELAGGGPAGLAILRVTGDSMEPVLSDRDDILVDTADAAGRLRDGIYVLRREDVLHVKRIACDPAARRLSIRSDNPRYPSWECAAEAVAIIGRVVWAGRRLG